MLELKEELDYKKEEFYYILFFMPFGYPLSVPENSSAGTAKYPLLACPSCFLFLVFKHAICSGTDKSLQRLIINDRSFSIVMFTRKIPGKFLLLRTTKINRTTQAFAAINELSFCFENWGEVENKPQCEGR